MKNFLQYIILLLFVTLNLYAQKVTDVSFEVQGEKINIYFTLDSLDNKDYEISVLLKRLNDTTFSYSPNNLIGDVGKNKYSTGKRMIIWNVTEDEMLMFDGDDFYFEVFINKIEKSKGIPWYYYVGTAVAGGTVAAVLLLGGSKKDSPVSTNFPTPPGRP